MPKPMYANSYSNGKRGKGKMIFFIIVLIHLAAAGAYFYFKSDKVNPDENMEGLPELPVPAAPAPSMPEAAPSSTPSTPEIRGILSDAQAAIDAGQLTDAQATLDRLVETHPDTEAIKLLGDVNMKLLRSSFMMPGKEYYSIQSGDYLQKIAKKFNTTVALIKTMNGMETDTIRLGSRLLVFNSNFTIHVSKSRNELDLMNNGKLFKRYSVGTGKYGKTPVASFTIVDKIIEPPWTRPSDNKRIEYGDPENLLGSRWMAIKSADRPELSGFGIHGTWARDSVGKQSSNGCIRMLNEEVEELFNLIPRKTTVIITE